MYLQRPPEKVRRDFTSGGIVRSAEEGEMEKRAHTLCERLVVGILQETLAHTHQLVCWRAKEEKRAPGESDAICAPIRGTRLAS